MRTNPEQPESQSRDVAFRTRSLPPSEYMGDRALFQTRHEREVTQVNQGLFPAPWTRIAAAVERQHRDEPGTWLRRAGWLQRVPDAPEPEALADTEREDRTEPMGVKR